MKSYLKKIKIIEVYAVKNVDLFYLDNLAFDY